jgi:threonine dehydratase
VISGGNLDTLLLDRIIHQGLLCQGRIMRFSAFLEDVPGSLGGLLQLISGLGANVVYVRHTRSEKGVPFNRVRDDLE